MTRKSTKQGFATISTDFCEAKISVYDCFRFGTKKMFCIFFCGNLAPPLCQPCFCITQKNEPTFLCGTSHRREWRLFSGKWRVNLNSQQKFYENGASVVLGRLTAVSAELWNYRRYLENNVGSEKNSTWAGSSPPPLNAFAVLLIEAISIKFTSTQQIIQFYSFFFLLLFLANLVPISCPSSRLSSLFFSVIIRSEDSTAAGVTAVKQLSADNYTSYTSLPSLLPKSHISWLLMSERFLLLRSYDGKKVSNSIGHLVFPPQ